MKIQLLLFAAAREAALGQARLELCLPEGSTLDDLGTLLRLRFPALVDLWPYLKVAVDRELEPIDRRLREGQEVALLPPVSGGSGPAERYRIAGEPLAPSEAERLVLGPDVGGLVTFGGAVRGESRGRRVVRLEYEAYAPLALEQFRAIGARLERLHAARLSILHRVGTLAVGELAVVVCAAAPHRAAAFRACEDAIAALKAEAAIWKREVYEDGSVWVGLGP